MNVGGHDDGSDGSGDDSDGDDNSSSDKSDDEGAKDDGELKEKKIQCNRIKKQHQANKAYRTLFDCYRDYLISHGAELLQSHLNHRNQCRTLKQKILELDGKESGVSFLRDLSYGVGWDRKGDGCHGEVRSIV